MGVMDGERPPMPKDRASKGTLTGNNHTHTLPRRRTRRRPLLPSPALSGHSDSRQRRSHQSRLWWVSGHRCPKFVQARRPITPPHNLEPDPVFLTPGHPPGDLLSRQRRSHLSPASCVSGHRCPKFVQSRGTLTPLQTHGARTRIQVPRTWGAPHRDRWWPVLSRCRAPWGAAH